MNQLPTEERGDRGSGSGASDAGEAAIEYLQSQLAMVTNAYDNLDRKAALLPPFLVGAAGILLGQGGQRLTFVEAALLGLALVVGAVGGWYSIEALRTRRLTSGPDPQDVASKMDRPVTEFRPALASVIADAIQGRRDELSLKAGAFNKAVRLAAVSLLLVAVARLLGGVIVDDSIKLGSSSQPTVAPGTTPLSSSVPAASPSPKTSSEPSPAPSATAPAAMPSPAAAEPLSFAMGYEQKAMTIQPETVARPVLPKEPDAGGPA